MSAETISDQLDREKRAVSYDVYDMTVRQLVDMVAAKYINVAPDYQRHFVWDAERESELIESVYLGIPVPSLYMAANRDGSWEVVDGVQRLSTILHFFGTPEFLKLVGRAQPLRLSELSRLTLFNGKTHSELPNPTQLYFSLRPLRVTTLNDKSDYGVRYDLFERLNTGGVELHDQEIRNSVFRGAFRDLLGTLSKDEDFRKAVRLPKNEQESALYEECVLRFFAFLNNYTKFDHSVTGFLSDYMEAHATSSVDSGNKELFHQVMKALADNLPEGITRGSRKQTPLNLYEAIAVGTALAIRSGAKVPDYSKLPQLIASKELHEITTGATNSRKRVAARIELVRDGLLS